MVIRAELTEISQPFLRATEIIDWTHPAVFAAAKALAANALGTTGPATNQSICSVAQACFEWVRDTIQHSFDYQCNPITCRASEVLQHRTGYCYAKSHLLAALLRANGIAAGFWALWTKLCCANI
jgi:transglutaminase-like putative cysteine protease